MPLEAEILHRVLHLSPAERAALARTLLESLDDDAPNEEDAEAAWEGELEARLGRIERGETVAIDWRDAVTRARAAIRQEPGK